MKNDRNVLPIGDQTKKILLTGAYVDTLAAGGGSAEVKGYNHRTMLDELRTMFGKRIRFTKSPSDEEIHSADVVFCNVGTLDSEGWDRPFALPAEQENLVKRCVAENTNTVVIVTSGGGARMTDWSERAKAILYAWYVGQSGNTALAEILAGKINPSGKLPITIEKEFQDSPGAGYTPKGEELYSGWNSDGEEAHPVYDVRYDEGIFVGYRWYEKKNIEPLFPFGHGLSYTSFEYRDLDISREKAGQPVVSLRFTVKNAGIREGAEVAQVYVQDVECSVPRPVKELKGFRKVSLKPGQQTTVRVDLHASDFAFWNPETRRWQAGPGVFRILVGSSSADLRLAGEVSMERFDAP